MRMILLSTFLFLLFDGNSYAQQFPPTSILVHSGVLSRIGFTTNLDPACNYLSDPEIAIVEQPQNGEFLLQHVKKAYPSYGTYNSRVKCNNKKVPGVIFYYRSRSGFVGNDVFTVRIVDTFHSIGLKKYYVQVQ